MKKLIIIGSTLIAFSAINLFANDISNAQTKTLASVTDTVPKHKTDSTKKKDSAAFAFQSNENVSVMDTVPKKDTTKKKDSIAYAYQSNTNTSFLAMDTVPKKDTTKKDSLFLAMR